MSFSRCWRRLEKVRSCVSLVRYSEIKLCELHPKKFMEKNANSFLKRISNRQKVGYVHVRVLYNKQKDVIVKKGMRE